MKSRREENREQTVKEIISLAWEQMAEKGPGQLSLRKISQDMRMSSAAIFRYFENRDALLHELTKEAYQGQNSHLIKTYQENKQAPFEQQLWKMSVAYRNWSIENSEKYLLMFGNPIPGFQPDWTTLIPITTQGLKTLVNLLEDTNKAGILNLPGIKTEPVINQWLSQVILDRQFNGSPEILSLAISVWVRLHGLVSLEIVGQLNLLVGNSEIYFEKEVKKLLTELLATN